MTTAPIKRSLPEYEKPPLVETIVGVQFERLAGFNNAHLGAFWKALPCEEWSATFDAPLLEPQFERFGDSGKWGRGPQLRLTDDAASRLQIKNRDGDRMIQVQNGRLHFNWMGHAGGPYPRYEKVREEFRLALHRFVEFLAAEQLGEFRANQWELTYLNQIPKGTVWSTPGDWGFFRPLGGVPTFEQVVEAESFAGKWHFTIPRQRGRLHVEWRHGLKSGPDNTEVVVLTLTARGAIEPPGTDAGAIFAGLDLGHETIVLSFEKLMSDEANQYWGLSRAKN